LNKGTRRRRIGQNDGKKYFIEGLKNTGQKGSRIGFWFTV
jgi:hypothetical protein